MSSDSSLSTFLSSPAGRTAAIAGGALLVLGAGSLLYPRNANKKADSPSLTKRTAAKSLKPPGSAASSVASVSDDESPAIRPRPQPGANTLNPVAVLWDVDVSLLGT